MTKQGKKITLLSITLILLAIDQIIKIMVKLNMKIGESFGMFGENSNWAQILFIENNGMAFGMQFGGIVGKLCLSIFRLVLIVAIIWFINRLITKNNARWSILISLTFVLAGAIGNIIDSAFYGLIFSESTLFTVADVTPFGDGYAPFLCGKVVDMFYFPIIKTTLPSWFPFWGGEEFEFFRPIFNFADACVSCSAIYMLFFERKFFASLTKKKEQEK